MKQKLKYLAPECEENVVILEGVIAVSSVNPYDGTPDEESWNAFKWFM